MERKLDPLSHIQHVAYKYERINKKELDAVAFVTRPTEIEPYHHIVINESMASQLHKASWVRDVMTLEEYIGGLTAHEVFHILLETFGYASELEGNPLWKTIDNILEDSRIEHQGTALFPVYARYIDLLLSSIQHEVDLTKVETKDGVVPEKINRHMKTLFHLVRFGVVLPESDPDFVRFLFPLALTSKRANRKDLLLASNAVYYYLEEEARSDPQFIKSLSNATSKQRSISRKELEEILQAASLLPANNPLDSAGNSQSGKMVGQNAKENTGSGKDGNKPVQVMQSSVTDAVKEQLLPKMVVPLAGAGNTTVKTENDGNEFVQQTIARYPGEVNELSRSLRHLFEKLKRVKAYDGELSVVRQQQAYLDVLMGNDESDYYLVNKPMVPDLEAVIGQDVSGSTDDMKEFFSACSVLIHTAMEQTPGVRSIHIDWSDDAVIRKTFEQSVMESAIHPRIVGGTQLEALLDLVENQITFKAKRRLLFVITDGGFYGDRYWPTMERLMVQKGITPVLVQVDEEGSIDDILNDEPINFIGPMELPLYHCTLRTLAQLFYSVVARELFRRGKAGNE